MTAESSSFPKRFPVLTTGRLLLRQVIPSDTEALFAFKSNPDVTQHYAQEPHRTVNDTLVWIQRRLESFARGEDFAFAITLRGDDYLIGSVALWNFDPGCHCGELGYELNPVYEKRGIMTEACTAVLDYGFSELGLHRIEANPFDRNTASRNLLLRLGFSHEGTLRERHFFRGQYLDQLYYGLLKADWQK